MRYYMATTVDAPFDDAVSQVESALKQEGFGVVTRIDMRETLKQKLGEDFRPYTILGACNPSLALEALRIEDKVGTMLPCNVVVQQKGDGGTEVAAIDPVASMQAIENSDLAKAAGEVKSKLGRVIDSLAKAEAAA